LFQELEILGDFVLNKLDPLKSATESVEILEGWQSVILDEGYKLKMKITSEALKLPDGDHIEVFIQNFQRRLITLANKLYSYHNDNEVTFDHYTYQPLSLTRLQKITYQALEDLIDYLQINFRKYFLFHERPPRRTVLIAVLKFTEAINDLQALSIEPNDYLNTVVITISDLIHNPEKITFHNVDYLLKFSQAILGFHHQSYEKDLTLFTKYQVINHNFNSVHIELLFTTEYSRVLESIESVNDKIEKLSWYLKRITQIHVQSEEAYQPKEKSLKERISHWLLEELGFLEQNNIIAKLQDNITIPGIKVTLDMSVAQLGCSLKFLVDAEIIKSPNDKELVKLVAKSTRTKRTENISPESLRIRFYDVEESTKEEVRALIIKLLNIIQNNKNYIILLQASIIQLDEFAHSLSVFWQ